MTPASQAWHPISAGSHQPKADKVYPQCLASHTKETAFSETCAHLHSFAEQQDQPVFVRACINEASRGCVMKGTGWECTWAIGCQAGSPSSAQT